MEYPSLSSGQEELAYLTSLMMLGSQIPWEKLQSSSSRSPRGKKSRGLGSSSELLDDDENFRGSRV